MTNSPKSKRSSRLRMIGIDALGITLLILAALVGWLPGPAGIPLFLAGLRLLAINHPLADRILERFKAEGLSLGKKIFSEHPRTRWLVDIISLLFFGIAFYLLTQHTKNIVRSAGIACVVLGITLLLGNRDRLQNLLRYLQIKK